MKLSKNATQHAGIDRLEDDPSARPHLVEREAQHVGEIRRLEMLDHLHGDHAAERFVRQPRR